MDFITVTRRLFSEGSYHCAVADFKCKYLFAVDGEV